MAEMPAAPVEVEVVEAGDAPAAAPGGPLVEEVGADADVAPAAPAVHAADPPMHLEEFVGEAADLEVASMAGSAAASRAGSIVPAATAAQLQELSAVRVQLAEVVQHALGTSAVNRQIILMNRDELQRHAVQFVQAPDVFKAQYNTREVFTWALSGFNLVTQSFYPEGEKTVENMRQVCGSSWVYF